MKDALNLNPSPVDTVTLQRLLLNEVHGMMGLREHRALQALVNRILRVPIRRLADLLSDTNRDISEQGFAAAMTTLLTYFVRQVYVRGAELIPSTGPLLVVSNHPAAYDMPILASIMGRDDLKIITSEIPAAHWLPGIESHFIMIGRNAHDRMAAVRLSVRHLRDGGALLIFPRGNVDPDPAVSPGASEALELWSPSLDLFLRQAPETRLEVSIVSGVLSPKAFHNPLTYIRRQPYERQKVAEILQVAYQMLFPSRLLLEPQASFGRPLTVAELRLGCDEPALLPAIIGNARQVLADHMQAFLL